MKITTTSLQLTPLLRSFKSKHEALASLTFHFDRKVYPKACASVFFSLFFCIAKDLFCCLWRGCGSSVENNKTIKLVFRLSLMYLPEEKTGTRCVQAHFYFLQAFSRRFFVMESLKLSDRLEFSNPGVLSPHTI